MVRNYKRNSSQHRWEEEKMANAVKTVRDGRMGFQGAADTFSLPVVTFSQRVKKKGGAEIVSKKKVIGLKGKKSVGILSSPERGTTTTAVICCNAAGQYVAPLLIFSKARAREH
jgi:hypothetical protein